MAEYKGLSEFFKKWCRGRGVMMAEELAKEIRKVLDVQAPVRRTKSGKLVATTKAKPYAPPRKVSGALQKSVKVIRTKHGAKVQVLKRYGAILERWVQGAPAGYPHKFVAVALKRLKLMGRNS